MEILIVKLSALGDVVHTLPALTTLRRHRPEARISWLIEPAAAELVRGHAALHRVVIWPRDEWRVLARRWRWKALAGAMAQFVRELRQTRFDLVIDFQGLAKSALWVAVARAERKSGFGRGTLRNEGAWLALNDRVPAASPEMHALDRNLHLIEALGFPRLPLRYDLPIGAEDRAQADRLLREVQIPPGAPFVAVNARTRWRSKNWQAQSFAAVARALKERGMPAVFAGASADRPALDEIESASGHALARLDGRTPLLTLAAVFERARVVLSTDTGPMHLAAAVGTPVVALFGPTAPWRTGPYGPEHEVLRVGIGCSPCFQRSCRTTQYEPYACMTRIQPDAVVASVCRLWDREAKAKESELPRGFRPP